DREDRSLHALALHAARREGGGRERHAHDARGDHVRHQRRARAARRARYGSAGQPASSLEAAQQRTTNEEIIVKTARTDQLSNGKRKANVKELKPAKATKPEDFFVALSECHFMNEQSMGE